MKIGKEGRKEGRKMCRVVITIDAVSLAIVSIFLLSRFSVQEEGFKRL